MKTRISIYSALILAALTFSAVSCNRIIEGNVAGGPITFSADVEYENGTPTRTVYAGNVTVGTSGRERIDWVKNDLITIAYKQDGDPAFQYGDYRIKDGTIQASGAKSTAAIEPVGSELYWGETANKDHLFYALYPANGFGGNTKSSLTGADVTGTIPATQAPTLSSSKFLPQMQYASMVAMKQVSFATSTVTLQFRPAFTAFEFILNSSNALPITVSKIEMEATTDLTGDFAFTVTGSDSYGAVWTPANTQVTSAGHKITVNFTTPVEMDNNTKKLDVTLLALPVQQSGVKITLTTSNGTKSLRLNDVATDTPVTFAPLKKYVITNNSVPGGETWTYTVDDIDPITIYGHLAANVSTEPSLGFNVKSYRTSSLGPVEPVKWKVQYSTSASGPWSDSQPASWQTNGAKFSIHHTSGDGDTTTGEPNDAEILRNHTAGEQQSSGPDDDSEQAAIAVLRNRGSLPSSVSNAGDDYFDLSKHSIYVSVDGSYDEVDQAEIAQETANCYVITRPGYYKFPLVYGNAIRNGAANKMAYDPQNGQHGGNNITYYLRRFVRHDDKPITDPWIHNNGFTVANAVVVWQDVPDASSQILLDDDISISGNYVRFRIRTENIRPGNILVAARAADGTILWSWHLWVTEKDLRPHTVVDKRGVTLSMMNYNLGWIDKTSAQFQHWNDWPFYIRIVQVEDDGVTERVMGTSTGDDAIFSVTQIGESLSVDGNIGSNTFYQWGRKDPILGAANNNTNRRVYSDVYPLSVLVESSTKVKTVQNDNGTIGQSIQTPYNIFYSRAGEYFNITSDGTTYTSTWLENHMYIGIADNNNGTSLGTAWYGNLWDTGLIARNADYDAAHGAGTGNALSVNNRQPVKSVYDPSPRGYVVPYTFAFTGFSDAAWNSNTGSTPRGSLSSDGEGYDFNDGNGGTIFLPFAGARGGDGVTPLYEVNSTMYYWTTGKLPYDDKWGAQHKSKNLTFFRDNGDGNPEIHAIYDQFSEGAYSVRPVIQTNFGQIPVGSTVQTTGQDVEDKNFGGTQNWQ